MFPSTTKLVQKQRTGRMANRSGLFAAARGESTANTLPRKEIATMESTRCGIDAKLASPPGDWWGVFKVQCGFSAFLKVVKYWPEKGKSGFLVWRYLLKRDDDEPAPWTRDGKERIKKLGLIMQVRLTGLLYTNISATCSIFLQLLEPKQIRLPICCGIKIACEHLIYVWLGYSTLLAIKKKRRTKMK